jgi:hypothetical protein
MIQYIPSSISNISVTSGYPDTAEIGVGPQMFATCFSFNFTGVSFGCDSNEAPCSVTFVGYKYDRYQTETRWVAQQTVSIPACTDAANCSLTPITVSNFTDLTSITVEAEVNGHATIWWADDLAFGWFDNTCDAGLCRTNVPDGIMKSDWTIRPRQAASKLISLIGFRGW